MKCLCLKGNSGLGGRGCGRGCVWGGLPWSGGAPGLQKEEVVLCSGSPQAMHLWLHHLHLLLRNVIPLEIQELQAGVCAPPNPIPMGAPALLSSHRHLSAASPGVLSLKPILVVPPVSLSATPVFNSL